MQQNAWIKEAESSKQYSELKAAITKLKQRVLKLEQKVSKLEESK